jgi:hypothetical protein
MMQAVATRHHRVDVAGTHSSVSQCLCGAVGQHSRPRWAVRIERRCRSQDDSQGCDTTLLRLFGKLESDQNGPFPRGYANAGDCRRCRLVRLAARTYSTELLVCKDIVGLDGLESTDEQRRGLSAPKSLNRQEQRATSHRG